MTKELTPIEWHGRYGQQARWTRDLRHYLYERVGMQRMRRVLDVGSGTGVLSAELHQWTQAEVIGLDISFDNLKLARRVDPQTDFCRGDALALPFPQAAFDVSLCHFVLLWVADPLQMAQEMRRVTRRGGYVLALAEPDYGGRIDHPPELAELGQMQGEALRGQGADPNLGRRLRSLFLQADLEDVETGILGGQWNVPVSMEAWESEWAVLEADLGDRLPRRGWRHCGGWTRRHGSMGSGSCSCRRSMQWGRNKDFTTENAE
jgi:SAM-dependent methyltransferase